MTRPFNPSRAALLLAMGAIFGCARPSPLDDQPYADAPRPHRLPIARLTAARDRDAAAQAASDPLAGEERLQPDRLVAAVLERNPRLGAMRHAWRAAVARFPQAIALEDPMLGHAMAPASLADDGVDDGHRVELSQKFPWPGKLALRGRIARREADAANRGIETVRQHLVEAARRAFYDYWYVHRAIDINRINIDLLTEFQTLAESRYAAGAASKQDALQAEVARYHLEHRAIVLERMRKVARSKINTLLHRDAELELPPPPADLPPPTDRPALAALKTRAVNARPELQAIAQRLEARRTARALARKQYFPDVTVMGTYNSMWRQSEHRWMIGAAVNLPLQIDRRRAAEAQALAESNRLLAELVEGVDEVGFEVTTAYDKLVESEHVVHLYERKLLPSTRENLDAAKAGYTTGKNDFLTLLTAEKNLMLVQLAHRQALSAYHQRRAELERAAGKPLRPADGAKPKNPQPSEREQ